MVYPIVQSIYFINELFDSKSNVNKPPKGIDKLILNARQIADSLCFVGKLCTCNSGTLLLTSAEIEQHICKQSLGKGHRKK